MWNIYVYSWFITRIFFSGAKAGRRHAGFSNSAATKQARGAGAEYDGVSALQLCYPHEYIKNYLIVFRAVYWRWLQLQEMGDRPLPIGLLASGGHLLSDIDEILVLFFIEIQYCWWTFMIFWFSFSFGIAEVNTCCKTNQVALSKLYKSKSEGVKSSFYIYLELPKSPFKRYCIQSVWNKC